MSEIFGEMNKFVYECAKFRDVGWCTIRKIIGARHFKRHRYYGKQIKGIDDANQIIYRKIISGEPFLAARYGDAELRTLVYTLFHNTLRRQCSVMLDFSHPMICLL